MNATSGRRWERAAVIQIAFLQCTTKTWTVRCLVPPPDAEYLPYFTFTHWIGSALRFLTHAPICRLGWEAQWLHVLLYNVAWASRDGDLCDWQDRSDAAATGPGTILPSVAC